MIQKAELSSNDIQLNSREKAILEFCRAEKSRAEIFDFLNIVNSSLNTSRNLVPLIQMGLIQMTEPDNPKSKNQKYYTTERGLNVID